MITAVAALLSVIPTWFKFKVPEGRLEPEADEFVTTDDTKG